MTRVAHTEASPLFQEGIVRRQPRLIVVSLIVSLLLVAVSITDALRSTWSNTWTPPVNNGVVSFSMDRVLRDLTVISSHPHPIGSSEEASVRAFLLHQIAEVGLQPQVQSATAISRPMPTLTLAGGIQNIFVTVPGRSHERGLLLVAHYDSVPGSPGAADDGAAVACLLEELRVLTAGPPPQNDVTVLFTDGEEEGLFGARAFAAAEMNHLKPATVLNFEARGSSGPVLMFQTSSPNGDLISSLSATLEKAQAASFMSALYKALSFYETDFTVFDSSGIPGMNFAFIGKLVDYHTAGDSLQNLDRSTLKQEGAFIDSMTHYMASPKRTENKVPNVVYFQAPLFGLISYSEGLARLIGLISTGVAVAVVLRKLCRRERWFRRTVWASVLSGAVIVGVAILANATWLLIFFNHEGYRRYLHGDNFQSAWYWIGFLACSAAIATAFLTWSCKRYGDETATGAPLLLWCIPTVITAIYLPGASYLFSWPLLCASAGYLVRHSTQNVSMAARIALCTLFIIPVIFVFVPFVYLTALCISIGLCGVICLAVTLLLGLSSPYTSMLSMRLMARASTILMLGGVCAIVGGLAAGALDKSTPLPSSLFYNRDFGSNTARWLSFDAVPDAWSGLFRNSRAHRVNAGDFLPFDLPGARLMKVWQTDAPLVPANPPRIEVRHEEAIKGARLINVAVLPPPGTSMLRIEFESSTTNKLLAVNGIAVNNGECTRCELQYFNVPADGLPLTLATGPSNSTKIRITAVINGIPEDVLQEHGKAPRNLIPSMFPYSNSTLLTTTTTL